MTSLPENASWPNGASAAICITFDNIGEAADINRNLWPSDAPIGSHYSVTRVLPQFLALVRKYDIPITYFAESWSLGVYPDAIRSIAEAGHEVAWHAWQHEAWGKECKDEKDERANFEKSFGADGIKGFLSKDENSKVEMYRGFRPPGGTIHGERTLKMCREYGLGYISPAAHDGALVPLNGGEDSIVVLPFRWSTVDAYYYMDAFSGLRKMKGVLPEAAQSPEVLVEWFIKQIDEAIEKGGFLSLLFHPFLNDAEERIQAMERVLQHLVRKRDEGKIWLARAKDIEGWVREHPAVLGKDPQWDNSSWR
jgi:peptidoglycan/xylan/chitin deacetylase (PgdA/CDA1 family)